MESEYYSFLCNGRSITIRLEPLAPFAPQFHEDCKLLMIRHGHARMTVDGMRAELSAGDMIFINVFSRYDCEYVERGTEMLSLSFDELEFGAAPPQ